MWDAALLPLCQPVEPVQASPTKPKKENFSELLPISVSSWTIPKREGQRQP
jgi:hypothetical protein